MNEIYIGIINTENYDLHRDRSFYGIDAIFVAEIAEVFDDEEKALNWVKGHGQEFVDRRGDESAVVATNYEQDKDKDQDVEYVAVKLPDSVGKCRVRLSRFGAYYEE